jgi:hypothetical protein
MYDLGFLIWLTGFPFSPKALLEQLYYIESILASWIRGLGAAKLVEWERIDREGRERRRKTRKRSV